MTRRRYLRGTSLIEVLLVITILGLLSMLAMAKWPKNSRQLESDSLKIAEARSRAIQSFRPVSGWLMQHDTVLSFTAMPDGSVIGWGERKEHARK